MSAENSHATVSDRRARRNALSTDDRLPKKRGRASSPVPRFCRPNPSLYSPARRRPPHGNPGTRSSMSDLILHHYAMSPYSEKIRNVLGFKGLAWKSVDTPVIMPKPDLMPLTGGYRKAPVLQLGRDVYCDTALMTRVLDRLQPTPPLMPIGVKASCVAFAQLEQTLFFSAIPTMFQPAGIKALSDRMGAEGLDRFSKDRAALFSGGVARRPGQEFGKTHFLPLMNALDQQLAATPFSARRNGDTRRFRFLSPGLVHSRQRRRRRPARSVQKSAGLGRPDQAVRTRNANRFVRQRGYRDCKNSRRNPAIRRPAAGT